MEIDVNETYGFVLKKVYNGLCLDCEDGEKMYVCMRDNAFEIKFVNGDKSTGWMAASSEGVSKLSDLLHVSEENK